MMRRSLLVAWLLVFLAPAALANHAAAQHSTGHRHFFFRHHHPFFIARNSVFFATHPFFFSTNPFLFPTFSPIFSGSFGFPFATTPSRFGSGTQLAPSLGFGDGFAGGAPEGEIEPRVIVVNAQTSSPPPRPGGERASVEQTPQGVTVIRGPGSRHVNP